MKAKLIFVVVLACFMQQSVYSQTITLIVDKNCKTFILLGDKSLLNKHVYDLPIQKGQSLQFQLNNPFGKKLFITIKGTSDKTKLNVENLPATFESTNPITTDKNLIVNIGNKKYDLKEPFEVALVCTDGSGQEASVAFTPVFTNSNQNINTTAGAATSQPFVIVTSSSRTDKVADQNKGEVARRFYARFSCI